MNRKVALFAVPLLGAGASLLVTIPASSADDGTVIATTVKADKQNQNIQNAQQESISMRGEDGSTTGGIARGDNEVMVSNQSSKAVDATVCWAQVSADKCDKYHVNAWSNVVSWAPQQYSYNSQNTYWKLAY